MNIEYTTTATCRPEVFERTLASFSSKLIGNNFKSSLLHLNVDPVPVANDAVEVLRVARRYFGSVNCNIPERPSFPAAVRWCWSQPSTDYFFHLEDDWEMTEPFALKDMVELMERHVGLSCVNLRAYVGARSKIDTRICLLPGLHRTRDAKVIASRLSLTANPEKQLRPITAENPEGGKQDPFIGTQVPMYPILRDIGREWLSKSGWEKDRQVYFTTWRKKKGPANDPIA